jgi:hypothetical protein
MDYKGKPNHPLPAKRYDIFIKYFETKVTEHQKQIECLRTLEQPYNIAKSALELHDYPHATTLSASGTTISIDIKLGDSHYKEFYPLVETIGKSLVKANLRQDWLPASSSSDTWYIKHRWSCKHFTILLTLELDWTGNKHCQVTQRKIPTTTTEYTFIWTESPLPDLAPEREDEIPF